MSRTDIILKKNESKILDALYYMLTHRGKITMSRAAQDQGIPVHFLLAYTAKHRIPLIMSGKDEIVALKKVVELKKKRDVEKPFYDIDLAEDVKAALDHNPSFAGKKIKDKLAKIDDDELVLVTKKFIDYRLKVTNINLVDEEYLRKHL